MKQLFILMTLTIFTSNQVLAYAPTAEMQADQAIEQVLDKSTTNAKPLNKKKLIRKMRKDLKKANKLTAKGQDAFATNSFNKGYKRTSKVAKRMLRNKRLLRRSARSSKSTQSELRAKFKSILTKEVKTKTFKLFKEEVEVQGGYAHFLENKINALTDETYASNLKKGNRSPASVDDLDVLLAFLYLILFSMFVAPVFLVIGLIMMAAGVVVLPLLIPAGILSVFGLSMYLVFVGEF